MKSKVCAFFSEKAIPLFETLNPENPDSWAEDVVYGVDEGGDFYIRLPDYAEESHMRTLLFAVIEWFGEKLEGVREWFNQRLLIVRFQPA